MKLRDTLQDIKDDLPASKGMISFIKNYYYNAGFRVLLNYRLGKYFSNSNFFFIRHLGNYYKMQLITKRNCDISYKAIIGKNVRFPHPLGIVIGEGVIVGNNVKIWQQVTLGSHGRKGQKLEYPVIREGAKIYAGTKIIGNITIGANAIVGANSVVTRDVNENMTAAGVPAKTLNTTKNI